MRKFFLGSKRRTAATAVVAVLLVGGSALAAWLIVTSSGQGNGKFGALTAPTLVQSPTPMVSDLVPNSAAFTGSVNVRVTNPNANPLYLKSIGTIQLAGGMTGGTCPGGWGDLAPFISVVPSAPSLSIPVNGSGTNGGVTEIAVPGIIKADDATPTCAQGASVAINLTNSTFSTAP